MSTATHLWNADTTRAIVQLDGEPAGHVEFRPPWVAVPNGTFDAIDLGVSDPDDAALALLKAFIALDEMARGLSPDRSTRQPPPNVRSVARFRETFAAEPWVASATDAEVQRAADAAWTYTAAKVRMKTGLDYDEWGGKQFMAASAIFKRVVRKYGTDVPEPVWD